jgi:hypothetical protein
MMDIESLDGSYIDLLPHLNYIPEERNQRYCGNCWVWAGTGIMEVALDTGEDIHDRLSIQYFNSKYNEAMALTGLDVGITSTPSLISIIPRGITVPWSNTNAYWADYTQSCPDGSSVLYQPISTNPSYGIASITPQIIPTRELSQETAINNIKSVLHQNKGVYFSFVLPTLADRDIFEDYRINYGENYIIDLDYCQGHSTEDVAFAHAVLCRL